MAQRAIELGLVLVLVAMMWAHTLSQPNCTPTIASLSPCLGFITGNASTPSSSCCTQLASVVKSQAQCLCTVLNGAPQLGFVVNQTQALTLPGACKIQTPPLSQCNAASRPPSAPAAGSPQSAPEPASPATPSAASAPSPTLPSAPSVPIPTTPSTPPSVPSNVSPTAPSTPSVPNTPSGTGSKTDPTTGETSSARSSIKFTPSLFFFFLLTMASALCSF